MATTELRAKLSLDKSLFDRGLISAQAGVSRLATGFTSIAGIGAKGMLLAGAAVTGLGTALALGTKRAFHFGGGLTDIAAISGRSVKSILLLRRGLQDAGISMEKIDRYVLTGKDRGDVIKRALANMTSKDWADAAASVGKQADILDQNSKTFDRVSDLLGRSGDKLQGFFVGVADGVSKTLLPILEKFDKTDFAAVGQKLGAALTKGAQVLTGLFSDPQLLFGALESYFRAAALGMGNVLIGAFGAAIMFFKDGMFNILAGIGSAIIATLLEAFQKPIAYFQAGIEAAMARIPKALGGTDEVGEAKERLPLARAQRLKASQQREEAWEKWTKGTGKPGEFEKAQKGWETADALYQQTLKTSRGQIPTVEERAARIEKEGVKFGFDNGGAGMTSAEWRKQAQEQANEGISGAVRTALGFQVNDVLGAGEAMSAAGRFTGAAAARGRLLMPAMIGGTPAVTGQGRDTWGGFKGFGADLAPALSSGGLSMTGGMDKAYKTGGYNETYTNKAAGERAAKEQEKQNPELTSIDKNISDIKSSLNTLTSEE